ncbi:MAG: radical SAM protein [Clostridia bacterium]|nr:radical SAM protein [Clostridia bacterium]
MTKSQKNYHIPVFIPHLGCRHRCVFCDQRAISGMRAFDLSEVKTTIDMALATIQKEQRDRVEIAFFGGSFTAIDPALMHTLLDLAQRYVDAGEVDGIRFSTRPDAVSEDVLDAIKPYRINAIELGLQSLDDRVLLAAKRGHTAHQAKDACRRIVSRGYTLTGQMMLGLPKSTAESEDMTARSICELGATECRIYPTVVLRGTPLGEMALRGEYTPLSVEDAVERAATVLDIFERRQVRCLRIGLCENDGLHGDRVIGGAHHPALGELVHAAVFYRRMDALLGKNASEIRENAVTLHVARGKRSQALGQRRGNAIALCEKYDVLRMDIAEDDALTGHEVCLGSVKHI